MNLADDRSEILPVAQALSKQVTKLRRQARRAPLPPTWWAELTVGFTDELLRPGRFLDRWLRPLGVLLDINADWQFDIPDAPETRELAERLRHRTPAERLRRTLSVLEHRGRDIQQAEEDLRLDEQRRDTDKKLPPGTRGPGAPQPMADDERQQRNKELAGLKEVHGAALTKVGILRRAPDEHDELLRRRRTRIVAALLSEDWCSAPYRPFALVAAALWRRVPPHTPEDLIHPPREIAETLAGWAHDLATSAVPKTLDRLDQLVAQLGGSIDEGAGPFDYDPIDRGKDSPR